MKQTLLRTNGINLSNKQKKTKCEPNKKKPQQKEKEILHQIKSTLNLSTNVRA